MTQILNESLSHGDMENQVLPIIGIDRYASSISSDDQVVTLDFTVRQKEVGEDLSSWLERGYDWIIDSDVSPGSVAKGRYLVFAELRRRSSVPERIIEIIEDLVTLTNLTPDKWTVKIGDSTYPATVDNIREHMQLSPHDYRADHEDALNEWREIAGLPIKQIREQDTEMQQLQAAAHIRR